MASFEVSCSIFSHAFSNFRAVAHSVAYLLIEMNFAIFLNFIFEVDFLIKMEMFGIGGLPLRRTGLSPKRSVLSTNMGSIKSLEKR